MRLTLSAKSFECRAERFGLIFLVHLEMVCVEDGRDTCLGRGV